MPLRKPSLSLLAAAALALAGAAHAVPISATPLAGSSASANGAGGAPDTTLTPVFAGSATSANAWDVGSAWSIGWGNPHGAYAVRNGAEGLAEAQSFARLSYSFTNSGATALRYGLDFKIHGGSIGNDVGAALSGSEALRSAYEARILVGGALRFSSAASVQHSAAGVAFNRSGVDLSAGADDGLDGFYEWAGGIHRVDLGVLGAGQSVTVVAEFAASALANVGSYSFDCGDPVAPCLAYKGSATASYGDPSDFFGSAAAGLGEDTFRLTVSAVPEPSGFALAAAGLLGMLAWRRRCA